MAQVVTIRNAVVLSLNSGSAIQSRWHPEEGRQQIGQKAYADVKAAGSDRDNSQDSINHGSQKGYH
jgi:hypothetical protein